MGDLIPIGRKRRFTLGEARGTLAVVKRITERSIKQVETVRRKHGASQPRTRLDEFEAELNDVLDTWSETVTKLGCEPRGLWLVDFDNGDGYWCWRYPERDIQHSHGYEDGYSGRERFPGKVGVQQPV